MNAQILKTFSFEQLRLTNLVMHAGKVLLVAMFFLMLFAVLHPDVRTQMRSSFVSDARVVLSTVEADLTGSGGLYKVAKVRVGSILNLEIYEFMRDGSQRLTERIEIPDRRDGFFIFNGQTANLAVEDIDGDGRPEIVAPTFDNNLVGRLNIYNFDATAGSSAKMAR